MGRRGMTAEEADDHVSEFGTGNLAGVDHGAERAADLRLAAVLVAMADEQRDLAQAAAERAGETEAWTEKWRTQSNLAPALKEEAWFEQRAIIAETYREEASIHRTRQAALEAGARALGLDLPD